MYIGLGLYVLEAGSEADCDEVGFCLFLSSGSPDHLVTMTKHLLKCVHVNLFMNHVIKRLLYNACENECATAQS